MNGRHDIVDRRGGSALAPAPALHRLLHHSGKLGLEHKCTNFLTNRVIDPDTGMYDGFGSDFWK